MIQIAYPGPHLFWRSLCAHAPSTRTTAMLLVASTTAMEGGSAENAGATILPHSEHPNCAIIRDTHAISGLVNQIRK